MSVFLVLMPGYDLKVERALFGLARRVHISGVIAPVLLPLLIVAGYGASLPQDRLATWLVMMFCATISGAAIYFGFRRMENVENLDERMLRRWQVLFLLHLFVVGTAWGGITLLFDQQHEARNSALLVIYLGVMSAAVNTTAIHSPRSYFFSVGCSALIVFPMLTQGFGDQAFSLQLLLVFYLLIMANAAWNSHRTVLNSVRLQFANEELLIQKEFEAKRAERANREKSLFLAAASHDLRQPVHALLLLVEALRQRTKDTALTDMVGYIRQAGQAISKLFAALMELSRLESGLEKSENTEVSVAGVVREIAELRSLEAKNRNLRFDLSISGNAEQSWVRSDPALLARVVDNIVGNAIRYTRQGGVLIALRRRRSGILWLEVWDTGIGIAQENFERIFDPYFQIANAERDRSKGMGLGLAIVRHTAKLLGYTLEVRSRLGKGSCFRLILSGAETIPLSIVAENRKSELSQPILIEQHILIIDDDPMVLLAMRTLLESWQADLRCYTKYDSALINALENEGWEPYCILCDYRLPGVLSGIKVLDQLTSHYPDAVGILQTGELAPQVRAEAEDAGYLVLTKPVHPEVLASTLKTVLQAHGELPAIAVAREES